MSPAELYALLEQIRQRRAAESAPMASPGEQAYLDENGPRAQAPSHGRQGSPTEVPPAMREDADNRIALHAAINGFQPGDLDGLDDAQRRTIGHLTLAKQRELAQRDQLEAQGYTVLPAGAFTGYAQGGELAPSPYSMRDIVPGADPREAEMATDLLTPGVRQHEQRRPGPGLTGPSTPAPNFAGMSVAEAALLEAQRQRLAQLANLANIPVWEAQGVDL